MESLEIKAMTVTKLQRGKGEKVWGVKALGRLLF